MVACLTAVCVHDVWFCFAVMLHFVSFHTLPIKTLISYLLQHLISVHFDSWRAVTCCLSTAGLVHQRLYPELPAAVESAKDDGVQPFTEEQLRSLYYNYELEHVDEFVEEFLQVVVFFIMMI